MFRKIISAFITFNALLSFAQTDSLKRLPLKISHAEPIYIDMIRDLGARKGEKELNVGWQTNDKNKYIEQGGFVEYEFSPLNRLGLEIEVPFTYRYTPRDFNNDPVPHEKINAIKLAFQYSFLVSEKYRMSMAAGNIYEFELHSFGTMSEKNKLFKGNDINPFLIIAKRWGKNYHTLLYTDAFYHQGEDGCGWVYQANLSFHYVLPKAGHFVGIETNHELNGNSYQLTIRPQVKIKFSERAALGIVTGIPLHQRNDGLSFMVRLIYELK